MSRTATLLLGALEGPGGPLIVHAVRRTGAAWMVVLDGPQDALLAVQPAWQPVHAAQTRMAVVPPRSADRPGWLRAWYERQCVRWYVRLHTTPPKPPISSR